MAWPQRGAVVVYRERCYYAQPAGSRCYLFVHAGDMGASERADVVPLQTELRVATPAEAAAFVATQPVPRYFVPQPLPARPLLPGEFHCLSKQRAAMAHTDGPEDRL